MTLDIAAIRGQFPALARSAVFFDNPGGTQISRQSLERIQHYLVETNANHGGVFATSQASDAAIDEARLAMADFLNAARPEEIVFGPNMTSLTFRLSRALAREFQPGDVIVLTHMDHDANVSPWLRLAEDRNCRVVWVDFDPATGLFDPASYQAALDQKPKLVAFGYASNALGTVNPAESMTHLAKQAGALVYIDAVQYAAHGPIDVQQLDCDFLVCSAYKFFGPHVGVLYGRYELLDATRAYRVRPAPADPPGKFETGTGNFEGISGTLGALEYFAWLGQTQAAGRAYQDTDRYTGRRLLFKTAMHLVQEIELGLSQAVLDALQAQPSIRIYGPLDPALRVPTISVTCAKRTPEELARGLAARGIYVWNGNFYALNVTTRLGLEGKGGLLRIGLAHYNTLAEITTFSSALQGILN